MDKLIAILNETYDLLRTIPVTDTAVDTMHFARVNMQHAYRLAVQLKSEAEAEAEEAPEADADKDDEEADAK